jgi:hypothetical protein
MTPRVGSNSSAVFEVVAASWELTARAQAIRSTSRSLGMPTSVLKKRLEDSPFFSVLVRKGGHREAGNDRSHGHLTYSGVLCGAHRNAHG